MEKPGSQLSITVARRYNLRSPKWFSPANGEAVGRFRMAARRGTPEGNSLPQALYRLGRREVGNFEVDRQRNPRRACVCGRLSTRCRAGRRDTEEGFWVNLQRS